MRKLIFISLLLSVVACTKTENDSIKRNSPMRVNAMAESAEAFGSGSPVFLFWLNTDFSAIAQDPDVEPYLVAWPYGTIDSYKTETYNTGKKYPENDQTVYCTGYYPSTLIVGEDKAKNHWATLTVPSDQVGLTDVMVVKTSITGTESSHFETKNPKKPLKFYHAQSKINFKAKMGTDMAQNRYLRNIKVTIPGSELMSSLKWQSGRYIAAQTADEAEPVVLKDPSTTQLDPSQKNREIGNVYIYPGKQSLKIEVEVEMSDSPLFTESEIIMMKTEVGFNLNDGYGNALRENDAYEIILVINYDSIALKGRKAEWQEGGGLLIPIYPNN